jgi:hypothetical protein
MKVTAPVVALLAAACTSPLGIGPLGDWGSDQASLELTRAGGTATYQCGMGTVDSGWTEGTDGSWSATGKQYFGGGPIPAGGHPPHAALYSGRFDGDRLAFTVIVPDVGDTLGPFHLIRGGPSVSEICLSPREGTREDVRVTRVTGHS